MLVWMAVSVAAALTIMSLRTMAHAFAASFDASPATALLGADGSVRDMPSDHGRLGPTEFWMLLVEILFSIAISLLIIGFAFAAAMPGRLMIGALLAQVAVIGSLMAPAVGYRMGQVVIRPAAIALGIAQLAHIAFFIRAMQALLG
jgi:peptidoglycan/LPS O-acetylase OafA/YrhL